VGLVGNFGVIDKKEAKNFYKPYVCWFNLKSKALNKKNALIVAVQFSRKTVFAMVNKNINVISVGNNF